MMIRGRDEGGGFRGGGGWGGGAEEDRRGVIGDLEGFAGGEGDEGGACHAEGPAVVEVGGGQVVASVNGLLHEVAPLLASPHRVLVVQLRHRAAHFSALVSILSLTCLKWRFGGKIKCQRRCGGGGRRRAE